MDALRSGFSIGLVCAGLALATSGGKVELPKGRAADAAEKIGPDVRPASLPALAADAWKAPETWARFAALLSAEAPATAPDPQKRAELAVLAMAQSRWDDAWARFAECASSPPALAALLPRFLPGAPASDAALPDGVVLRPALPPHATSPESIPRGAIERRAMRVEGVRVGAATLALRVSVEGEGVEIDVEHQGGGDAKLQIAIPADPQYAFADEYVDWFRQEQRGVPHEVVVHAGDEPHTLYARFEPRRPEWPSLVPEKLPAQLDRGTLWLDPGADTSDRLLLEAVAQALANGPLKIPTRIRGPRAPRDEELGVRIDLSDAAARSRKLAWIAGAVEERALARAR
jgi:hypothetical protein